MKTARNIMLCAAAVLLFYPVMLAAGELWSGVVAVFEFFASVPTNPASFTTVSFVLSAVATGLAVSIWLELHENAPCYFDSWRDWREYHSSCLSLYGMGVGSVVIAAVGLAMCWFLPAAPSTGFRFWVSFAGFVGGSLAFVRIFAELIGTLVQFAVDAWRQRA